MIVVERPKESSQLYMALNLNEKYHFAVPTAAIPALYNSIQSSNNNNVEIEFIPRTCLCYNSKGIFVRNELNIKLADDSIDMSEVHETILRDGNKCNSKRSMNFISIGLQTMYSHQQHIARYCMLPHSKPHVPTVKKHELCIRKTIIAGYRNILNLIAADYNHPLQINSHDEIGVQGNASERLTLREDLFRCLVGDDIDNKKYNISSNVMFEACTIQPTGTLKFHKDTLNCPSMDCTFALHIPSKEKKCLSLLYYSRKCVGNHAIRVSNIQEFHHDQSACNLMKLCLKSLMATKSNFDYQALFENKKSFNEVGKE